MDATLIDKIIDLAMAIQQIPSPTFSEGIRAAFVKDNAISEGLVDVGTDEVGNVYGRIPGVAKARPVIVTAHLDTVFPSDTDLHLTRDSETVNGPGIGDNSLGVAGLFGLYWALRSQNILPLPGDIWLVANVCEEGLGDLRGMKAVVKRFGAYVQAYLILEGMSLGQVYHRGLGVKRYRIQVHTRGGHSWVDFGKPSAIHILADMIVQLKALALPEKPRTSLNVGVVAGGTTVNTIAAEAHLELDLRSESPQELTRLASQVEALAQTADQTTAGEVTVAAKVTSQRPSGELAAEHPLVRLAVSALEEQGITARLNIGSTDANVPLARGLPAVCVGLTYGSGAHTVGEQIQIAPIGQGLAQLVSIVEKIWGFS